MTRNRDKQEKGQGACEEAPPPSRIGFPKNGSDFRKARCASSKSYSVLCASDKERGAAGAAT
ncbi:hypothetical protein FFR93_25375 [Rhizobium sp. MHM7A]|nr:hypothetical protein FFR93_25375 [Rhizobium sp. MHM7A]